MNLNDFYQLMEEIETVANAYNMHITHFVAGDTIELTIEKYAETAERGN